MIMGAGFIKNNTETTYYSDTEQSSLIMRFWSFLLSEVLVFVALF